MMSGHLIVDVFTTGYNFDGDDPVGNHAIVSIGAIWAKRLDSSFKPTSSEKFHCLVKTGVQMTPALENINGVTNEELLLKGASEEDALVSFVEFLQGCGVNLSREIAIASWAPHMIDIPFLKKLFHKYDMPITFSFHSVDTQSIASVLYDIPNAREFYNVFLGKSPKTSLDVCKCNLNLLKAARGLTD